jgi:AcrR family transcriptional regulator
MTETPVTHLPWNVLSKLKLPAASVKARATVNAILDATAELLVEKGFEGVNTNNMAQRAGVSPAAIYRYFDDKFAVYATLADRYLGSLFPQLAYAVASLGSDYDLRAIVNVLIDTTADFWRTYPAFAYLWNGEWSVQGEEAAMVRFAYHTALAIAEMSPLLRHLGKEGETEAISNAMIIALALIGNATLHHQSARTEKSDRMVQAAKVAVLGYLEGL